MGNIPERLLKASRNPHSSMTTVATAITFNAASSSGFPVRIAVPGSTVIRESDTSVDPNPGWIHKLLARYVRVPNNSVHRNDNDPLHAASVEGKEVRDRAGPSGHAHTWRSVIMQGYAYYLTGIDASWPDQIDRHVSIHVTRAPAGCGSGSRISSCQWGGSDRPDSVESDPTETAAAAGTYTRTNVETLY